MAHMILSCLSLALVSISLLATAMPVPEPLGTDSISQDSLLEAWVEGHRPGKYLPCTADRLKVRKDYDSMTPEERKAYTDAIKCMATKPSQLDQTLYPAATNRYMDYAVIHVLRTRQVHLSGFFLTWHRYFLHLFEEDLANECGYTGAIPYWNWPETADNLHDSAIFDGSEHSMSGDGEYRDSGPVVLSSSFQLPQGSGGGCITSGPFADWEVTMQPIPINYIIQGLELPPTAFELNQSCLTRDLNTYAAQSYTNYDALYQCLETEDIESFDAQINGVLGGGELGLHSGAHFAVGSPASSIYVSVMDPVWWPLHAFLDNVYASWQNRHPLIADAVYGTETAVNVPPSADVTLDTIQPDWGYFQQDPIAVGELISTTSGPFCYEYDVSF
ncbi:uncharacterized protein A1O5_07181 [Cladophialophora psammophila CBS 110553]|uniref:Tyrosinase copper-binding domain-containing protein n=1 Tax=Cladophialophora psammophila CBS 110553 TaxID=1182543 RepID=W9WQA9_9EURO|nr:uncharacterized protein A1O5_07181 [Cladophialophora psammophila CBS 110553]EXJ70108.1 hypothetical protein A1O5_07181 [Cladophialophora psammophila CBS 110553]